MSFNPNEHLIPLKGKQYLQVMWRIVWFRDEKPGWAIETTLEALDEKQALFKAKIYDDTGALKSTGYGSETLKDFKDYIEKAETKAIGRALAALGYGAQFAPELDDGDLIVDSPAQLQPIATCHDCGEIITDVTWPNGATTSAGKMATQTTERYGVPLCGKCYTLRAANGNQSAEG